MMNNKIREEYGKQIKKGMELMGITRTELATELKIKPTQLAPYINGTSMPTLDLAVEIANILCFSIDELKIHCKTENTIEKRVAEYESKLTVLREQMKLATPTRENLQ